ncbi:MAG: DinB family protein [Balneola sp.]
MQNRIAVVKSNIYFLEQGVSLLSSITDDQYAFNNGRYFKSGIGRHFRHIIEHYTSLINGYTDRVNYDARERELKLETTRNFAISTIRTIIDSIEIFESSPELIDKQIEVMSNEGIEVEDSPWSTSTVRRELQFLISHTVHHYALIALILKTMDVSLPDNFGIAPSTLKHESDQKEPVKAS